MFEGACIRVCAAQGSGLLEFGLAISYANQCWRGHASGRALRGVVGCLSWRPATPTKNCVHQGVALQGPVQEGRRLVAMRVHCVANGDRCCFEAPMLPQPVHSTSIAKPHAPRQPHAPRPTPRPTPHAPRPTPHPTPNPLRCHVERLPFQV